MGKGGIYGKGDSSMGEFRVEFLVGKNNGFEW